MKARGMIKLKNDKFLIICVFVVVVVISGCVAEVSELDLGIEAVDHPSHANINEPLTIVVKIKVFDSDTSVKNVPVYISADDERIETKKISTIESNDIEKVSFVWTPKTDGVHTIDIEVGHNDRDPDLSNNHESFEISVYSSDIDDLRDPSKWIIDYKSTRVIAESTPDGTTHADFVGTIRNYASADAPQVKIEVKIPNDGVVPVEPEGGSVDVVVFATKAVYTYNDLKSGDTKDFVIRAKITDPKHVDSIDFVINVLVKDRTGYFTIYSENKTLEVLYT